VTLRRTGKPAPILGESGWKLPRVGRYTVPATAFRYWRVNSLTIPGGGFLEISELQLFIGASQQTGATVTSSDAPTGLLSLLTDGNLTTRCYWTEAVAEGAGFWIKFDFGAGNDKAIDGVKQGGFDTSNRYIQAFSLQYSTDNSSWTTLGSKSGLTYPGNNTLSAMYSFP
jgi:hypothetical protein